MSDFDDRIKAALGSDSVDIHSDEPSVRLQLAETFRGKTGWMSAIGWVYLVVFGVLYVWTAVMFFLADDLDGRVFWGVVFLFCATATGMLKIWFMNLMNRNNVLRELKRLELAVTMLAERIEGPGKS